MTASKRFLSGVTPLLFITAFNLSAQAAYHATSKYLGCYDDPHVSILGDAKLSTIAMTPQYCANWCGGRGFAYGGVEFGT